MAAKDYIEGTTESGFCYRIDNEALDDWELVEMIADMDGVTSSIAIIKGLLGDEQYDALKEHCRSPKGRVLSSRMEKEVTEILGAAGPVKK